MKRHNRSIYGCTQAPPEFKTPKECRLTYNPATDRLYVHVFVWPYKQLRLNGFAGKVKYAQLLNDASEIRNAELSSRQKESESKSDDALILALPLKKPDAAVPVIELFLK